MSPRFDPTRDPEYMRAAIRAVYDRATPLDVMRGRSWYPDAYRIASAIADRTAVPADRVAAAIAALSPRNPWAWTVADAAAFADAYARGSAGRPVATTFGANADRAWSIVKGGADWRTSALKVRSFVSNILGDTDAVTVDVWAVRIATDGLVDAVPTDAAYRRIADAYRSVAADVGETPRELQAVTWTVAEREGLGSRRRGRHGATVKRGTLTWAAALLAA